jgi:hypothetical protein
MNQLNKRSDFVFKVLDPPHYTGIVQITLSLKNYKEYVNKACGKNKHLVPKSVDS